MLDTSQIFQTFDQLFPKQRALAIALSGGSDSLALTLLAKEWATKNNVRLIALTVDHQLRNESAEEAEQVKQWMQEWDVEHHILTWKGKKPKNNIQALAREARYRLMSDFCQTHNIGVLCTAHTKEDQAETFLMRLERESGVTGLSAMQHHVQLYDIDVWRPLLNHHRNDLQIFLKDHKQIWIEDPSNQNFDFDRVKIRKWLHTHHNTQAMVTHICQTITHMQRARDFMENQLESAYRKTITTSEQGYVYFDQNDFLALHEELQLRLLSRLLVQVSKETPPPRFTKLRHLYTQLQDSNFNAATLHGCHLYQSQKSQFKHRIYIVREHQVITAKASKLVPGAICIWDQRFAILSPNAKLLVKKIQQKDYALIKEHLKSKKIEINQKILLSLPAIYHLEKLVSVPHINYYASPEQQAVTVKLI